MEMDFGKQGKGKKNLLLKTWDRCRSLPKTTSENSPNKPFSKSKSWHSILTGSTREFKRGDKAKSRQVAPDGCFSVYVGPERQRFVIKTEHANHPLFKLLLEDAEREYGYNSEGPLLIPCDVDLFYKVLAEMESREVVVPSCGFPFSPFHPSRRLGSGDMAKVCGSYGVLSSSPLLKINRF